MKIFKIFSLLAVAVLAMTACSNEDDNNDGKNDVPTGNLEKIVNEWRLDSVNGVEAEFTVYLHLKDDSSFDMYQMVYTNQYQFYQGTYTLTKNVLAGSYLGGKTWKCDYKVSISEDEQQMTLVSVEDESITCVYEATTIPESVKSEAVVTRAAGVEPML
jgi:hypothetical protein